jgi:hypothetical protein
MKGSKLKVMRAVVALERFTVADLVGWTGLESSQVIPQLARLQDEAVIEHDTDRPVKTDKPRPAHRPVRHYRVSSEASNRQKTFDEIRMLRAAIGEDPISQRLSVIEGRLKELQRLLSAFRDKKLGIDRGQQTEYEVELRSIENVLDEAVLEIDEEDKELTRRVDNLRKVQEELSSSLSATPAPGVHSVRVPVEVGPVGMKVAPDFVSELRLLLHHLSHHPSRTALTELERVSPELKPIFSQIMEMREFVEHLNPAYNPEARLDYAVSRIAAEVAPDLNILLPLTESLLRIAPDKDRFIFEFNYGNLMAWAGNDKDAFKYWKGSVAEVGSIGTPFRVVIGGLVDPAKMNEKVVEELESAARHSRGLISMASKTSVETIECLYSPTAALSDPFLGKIDLAVKAPDARYAVYGLVFRDLFRAQPGISYSRLATTLVRSGVGHHKAWEASQRVNSGEILVLLGHFGDPPSESDLGELRSMLRTKFSADVIDLRPSEEVRASGSVVAG